MSYSSSVFNFKYSFFFFVESFDEFGGTDDFTTEDVAFVLGQYGLINYVEGEDRTESIEARSKGSGVNSVRVAQIRGGGYALEDSDDDFEIYD